MDNILHQLLDNPIRMRQMKEMAAYLARPAAAENTVALLEDISRNAWPDPGLQDRVPARPANSKVTVPNKFKLG
jgi:nitrous oxide reductase accessory protein NosL